MGNNSTDYYNALHQFSELNDKRYQELRADAIIELKNVERQEAGEPSLTFKEACQIRKAIRSGEYDKKQQVA